uniref:Restorer of fertility-like protein n=1 Tax=Triticum aestivum TaxID=4565 RepID=A0A7S5V958_WHEAT|nr:restorer of fertility-like protein [Triticum aestivum]QIP66506.1 restorer of fertility-like protein [Triticum aestivum]
MPRLQVRSFCSSFSSRAYDLLNELQGHLDSRTLRPELARQLFDEMLRQPVPVSARALNGLFAALARAPPSTACTDGPALAVDLFNHMARAGRRRMTGPTVHTYNILIDCCHRACRPDLGPAFFGCLLKTGITMSAITYSSLFKFLCDMRRTKEALNVLLHRMPDDLPNVISYSVILKSFCDSGRSQLALDLLRVMAKKGGDHSPDVMAYNMVMDGLFKEGEVSKACDLFHEMIQQGVVPNEVTYSSIINALCKARAMDKAEVILRHMVRNGVQPHDSRIYNTLIHGFLTSDQLKEAFRLLKVMRSHGSMPNVVTCTSVMDYLCKHGRIKEAEEIFYSMAVNGRNQI